MPTRLGPDVISADVAVQDAIAEMADYNPSNDANKLTALNALKTTMLAKQAAEGTAQRALAAARDDAAAAERAYHEAITDAKTAVKAQYGKDSNEVQAVGLKKSSEITRGGRRKPSASKKTE